jgi:subtilisin-like proprotein convertase family protein
MKLKNLRLLAVWAALASAGSAWAATLTGENLVGGAITDLSTVTFDINIGSSGLVSGITVQINLVHNQVGDLHITLTNPTGDVTSSLVYRLGGNTYNRNYSGAYTFDDDSSNSLWTAASEASGTNAIVAAGDYFASTTLGSKVFLDSDFGGTEALGTWTLTIHDLRSGNNTGANLNSWALTLETDDSILGPSAAPLSSVPEPSTYILFGLGLGGLAAIRRRR